MEYHYICVIIQKKQNSDEHTQNINRTMHRFCRVATGKQSEQCADYSKSRQLSVKHRTDNHKKNHFSELKSRVALYQWKHR